MHKLGEFFSGLWDYVLLVCVLPFLIIVFLLAGEKETLDD